jgi:hypothetical protein
VNNTVRVFEDFIQLMWYTKGTPLVKLNKEIGDSRVHRDKSV